MSDFLTLATFSHREISEAYLLKARLDAEGVACLLTGTNAFDPSGEIRIQVPIDEEKRAVAVLNGVPARARKPRAPWWTTDKIIIAVVVCATLFYQKSRKAPTFMLGI